MLAGANVVMPNLSPPDAAEKYTLYDGKLFQGAESARHLEDLKGRMAGHRLPGGGRPRRPRPVTTALFPMPYKNLTGKFF